MNNLKNSIAEYVKFAKKNIDLAHAGDSKSANVSHEQLSLLSADLLSMDGGLDELKQLLIHRSPEVRLWAAADLISLFPGESRKVLEELSELDDLIAIDARVILVSKK